MKTSSYTYDETSSQGLCLKRSARRAHAALNAALRVLVFFALALGSLFIAPTVYATEDASETTSPLAEIQELIEGALLGSQEVQPEVSFGKPKQGTNEVLISYEVVVPTSTRDAYTFSSSTLTPYIGKKAKVRAAGRAEQTVVIGSVTEGSTKLGTVTLYVSDYDAPKGTIAIQGASLTGSRTTITAAAAAPAALNASTAPSAAPASSAATASEPSDETVSSTASTTASPLSATELQALNTALATQATAAAQEQVAMQETHSCTCTCAACTAAATSSGTADLSQALAGLDADSTGTDSDASTTTVWSGRIPPRTPDVIGSEYAGGAGNGSGTWIIPATSDDTNLAIPAAIGAGAGVALIAAILLRRKNK